MLSSVMPLLIIAWGVLTLVSLGAIPLHFMRHGSRRIAWSLLCPVGAALCGAFLSIAIGLAERVWTLASIELWLMASLGFIGATLAVLGWRQVLRTPLRAGECTSCGYPIRGLCTCPECGRAAPPPALHVPPSSHAQKIQDPFS